MQWETVRFTGTLQNGTSEKPVELFIVAFFVLVLCGVELEVVEGESSVYEILRNISAVVFVVVCGMVAVTTCINGIVINVSLHSVCLYVGVYLF